MNIEEKLKSIKLKKSNLTKLKTELSDQKKRLAEEKDKLNILEQKLNKEYKEYKKLENLSVVSIISSIKGNKTEKLEKEKQEYLAAKLEFENAKENVSLIRERIDFISNELKSNDEESIEKEYQEIIKEKENLILSEGNKHSEEFMGLIELITDLDTKIKELKEAVDAGEAVNTNFTKIIQILDSAQKWGTLDVLGGGLTSTYIKHQKISEANSFVNKSKFLMKNYIKELDDVDFNSDIKDMLKFSDFEMAADFLLDNFIVDFIVLEKIRSAIDKVKRKKDEINKIQDSLKSQLNELKNQKEQLDCKKQKLLEEN